MPKAPRHTKLGALYRGVYETRPGSFWAILYIKGKQLQFGPYATARAAADRFDREVLRRPGCGQLTNADIRAEQQAEQAKSGSAEYADEEWRSIADSPDFEVSSKGRVRCLETRMFIHQTQSTNGYWLVSVGRRSPVHVMVGHAFLPNPFNLRDIDHIDTTQKDNNCVTNLRWCDHSGNSQNTKKIKLYKGRPTSSIYKGCSWDRRREKWVAYIKVEGKKVHGKEFNTEREGGDWYDQWAVVHFKEFALTNAMMVAKGLIHPRSEEEARKAQQQVVQEEEEEEEEVEDEMIDLTDL